MSKSNIPQAPVSVPVTVPVNTKTGMLVLLASSLLSVVLGSIHAFSVFLEPLEIQFEASRSAVSLTYSIALVFLTAAVLMGHRVFHILRSATLVLFICILGSAGAAIAGFAGSLFEVWIGYGVVFGAANGLGYGFGLQLAAQANPQRAGLVMGVVTACYALGAAVSPPLYAMAVSSGGLVIAFMGLSVVLVLIAPLCAGMLYASGFQFQKSQRTVKDIAVNSKSIILLWAAYGSAVAAGLMVIGHATGILKSVGWLGFLWVAPVTIAILNMAGSLVGGALVDRFQPVRLLAGLCVIAGFTLLLLSTLQNGAVALMSLGVVGFTYGAIIASYPAVVLKCYGAENSAKIYGRVFTAWGLSGLFAPWLAGALFDQTNTYTAALIVASGLSFLSVLLVMKFFKNPFGQSG